MLLILQLGPTSQPVQRTLLWPAAWLSAFDKGRGSKSVEVQRVWEVCDDRLQFMVRSGAFQLHESSRLGDVSGAYAALVDAHQFAGGPILVRGLVVWRGTALKARSNVADAHDAGGVFMYRDSSIAALPDLGRGIKAVMDVLDSMIRNGVSLARSYETTVQWDRILGAGPVYPGTLEDSHSARGSGLGDFLRVTGDLHNRLSDFIHKIVVHRRDEAIRGWRNWLREDPLIP